MLIPAYALRSAVAQRRSGKKGQEEDFDADEPILVISTLVLKNNADPLLQSSSEYDQQIEEYNRAFKEQNRQLGDRVQEDWVLLNRIFSSTEGNTLYKILISISAILVVVYLLSPYDLIPDYYGLIGTSRSFHCTSCDV